MIPETPLPVPAAERDDAIRVPLWYGAILVAALLLAAEPYRGVRHDAMLYLGQAIVRLDPDWWKGDAYFAFGSQDRYTLFSRLLVAPVAALGISVTAIMALMLGRLATFVGLYLIVADWPPLRRWLALAAIAGFSLYYGGKSFGVREPFLTARTFAEPLSLFAIAAVLRGRKGWGAVALAAAFAMHPLIALPVALTIWVYLAVAEDRRWAWAAVTLLPVVGLGYAGVAPFDGLLRRYDDLWFEVIGVVNAPAFVSEWSFRVYVAILGYSAVIWIATWKRADPLARFSRVAAILGPLTCAASFYLADWEHNILLTQLQFWRTIWVGELLSVLWVPVLVLDHWRRGPVGRLAAAAVCAGLPVVQDDLGLYGWAVLLWMVLWLVLSLRDAVLDRRVLRLAFAGTVLMGTIAIGQHCWDALYMLRAGMRGFPLSYPASIPFRVPLLTLSVIGSLLLAWQRPRWRPGCATLVMVLGVAAVWQTDQRTPFARFVESAAPAERPFQSEIPVTATVYWVGEGVAPDWFLLHRAAFGEAAQFSGALFNRGTALAAKERWYFLGTTGGRQDKCNNLQSWASRDFAFYDCTVPLHEFRGYCTQPGLHPDFVVSDVAYPLPRRSQWRFDPHDGGAPVDYYLYACEAVRSSPPPQPPAQ